MPVEKAGAEPCGLNFTAGTKVLLVGRAAVRTGRSRRSLRLQHWWTAWATPPGRKTPPVAAALGFTDRRCVDGRSVLRTGSVGVAVRTSSTRSISPGSLRAWVASMRRYRPSRVARRTTAMLTQMSRRAVVNGAMLPVASADVFGHEPVAGDLLGSCRRPVIDAAAFPSLARPPTPRRLTHRPSSRLSCGAARCAMLPAGVASTLVAPG